MPNKHLLPELNLDTASLDYIVSLALDNVFILKDEILQQELLKHDEAVNMGHPPEVVEKLRLRCEQMQDMAAVFAALLSKFQKHYAEIQALEGVDPAIKEKWGGALTKYKVTHVYDLENTDPDKKIMTFLENYG